MFKRRSAKFTFLDRYQPLPADWNTHRLRDLAEILGGGTPSTDEPNFWDGDIPWLTPTEMNNVTGRLATSSERFVSLRAIECSNCQLLPIGSIVITTRGTIGKVAIAGVPLTCNQSCEALVPKDEVDSDFLYYLLTFCQPIIERFGAGTTFMSVTRRDIKDIRFVMPTEPEQRNISSVLIKLDDAIDVARQELEKAHRLKTSLLQQLFTRGQPGRHLRYKQTKLGEVPEEWDVLKLKKCGKWGTGGTPDRDNKALWGGTIPWVKSGEVDYQLIEDAEEKITEEGAASINGGLLPSGTLLVAMYGAGITRGKAALLGIPAYVNQAIAVFERDNQTDNEWLLYWFERNYDRVRAFAGGSNQDNLNLYLLKNIEIARPKPPEQMEIAHLLRSASVTVNAINHKIEALRRLKNSLLQNLLTGKTRLQVDVQNSPKNDAVPASVYAAK